MMGSEEFEHLVKDILSSMYDPVRLETHALISLLGIDSGPSETRGQALREAVIEAVEQLCPAETVAYGDPAWLSYRILRQRYIEGRDSAELCTELGISRSTFYRYHKRALEAVSRVLWERRDLDDASPMDRSADSEKDVLAAHKEAARVAESSKRQPVKLRALLENVQKTVSALAEKQNVDLRLTLPDSLPKVYASESMIEQAILSILTKGINMAEGGRLFLRVHANGHAVYCRIGPFRIDPSDSSAQSKLPDFSVSSAIMGVYGGSLVLKSEERTHIWVCLQLPTLALSEILIIDDNPDLVRLYERYLRERHYIVRSASNGQTIRERLAEGVPDLVLLDILMPNEDGWRILQQLKSDDRTRNVPVIVCSVLDQPELALALGAEVVLQKPVEQRLLLETVRRTIRS